MSAASARQLASRARRAVADAPPPVDDNTHNEIAGALMAALAAGDMDGVVRLLHPDVTFTGDSNRKAPTAPRVIHGPRRSRGSCSGSRDATGRTGWPARNWPSSTANWAPTPGCARGGRVPELLPRITAMTVRDGKVCAVWDVADPDKFTGSPLGTAVRRP